VLSNVIDYVLPHRCASCSELITEDSGICGKCFQKLNFITSPYCNICGFPFAFAIEGQIVCGNCIATPPKYDLARSLLKFDENSKNLLYGFKYNDKTHYAKFFSKLLIARYRKEMHDVDIITPVLMNRFKRLLRNYNPPQVLAKEISNLLNKQIVPDLLIKTKWTKPQASLTKSQRQKNLAGSIKVNSKYDIRDKIILLIDDVKTTGATSDMCSFLLKSADVKSAKLMTICMTL